MAAMIGQGNEAGRISAVDCPPLELVTGIPAQPWRVITPDDGHIYDHFVMAHDWQDSWSDSQSRAFWSSAIHLWPKRRGPVVKRELLAIAVASYRPWATDDELAADLGYEKDSLRKMGVFDLATRRTDGFGAGGPLTVLAGPHICRAGEHNPGQPVLCSLALSALTPDEIATRTADAATFDAMRRKYWLRANAA